VIKCPNKDCEYHGIDGCCKNITLVELKISAGLRCLQYTPRVTCKDLDAPFRSRCRREHGKYKSDNKKVVT